MPHALTVGQRLKGLKAGRHPVEQYALQKLQRLRGCMQGMAQGPGDDAGAGATQPLCEAPALVPCVWRDRWAALCSACAQAAPPADSADAPDLHEDTAMAEIEDDGSDVDIFGWGFGVE